MNKQKFEIFKENMFFFSFRSPTPRTLLLPWVFDLREKLIQIEDQQIHYQSQGDLVIGTIPVDAGRICGRVFNAINAQAVGGANPVSVCSKCSFSRFQMLQFCIFYAFEKTWNLNVHIDLNSWIYVDLLECMYNQKRSISKIMRNWRLKAPKNIISLSLSRPDPPVPRPLQDGHRREPAERRRRHRRHGHRRRAVWGARGHRRVLAQFRAGRVLMDRSGLNYLRTKQGKFALVEQEK